MAFAVETCRTKFCKIKQTNLTVWVYKPSKCSGTQADIATFVDRLEHACFICMCGIFVWNISIAVNRRTAQSLECSPVRKWINLSSGLHRHLVSDQENGKHFRKL